MGWIHYLGRNGSRERILAGDVPKWISNRPRNSYIKQVVLSAPPWLDLELRREILAMHAEAQRLTLETGVPHVLDHDIPLNSPHVCGLSVPWNIVIRTELENSRKSNRFPDPNQLSLPL